MFHGVDRRAEDDKWVTLKYHRDDEAIFKKFSPSLAFEIAQLVAEGDLAKVFLDPEIGLEF
eukprot:CAMPEP_0172433296 /NCGR_PEP_ID=MMETSP1064-20121228/67570_1 /TAXON_ID=202472 /ORGANISM="Aulacoseira subarctica , Strain CCAP 1002/5" /LENGTH=60 /DNA_ID=CAMNT_0013181149 /DNA_START=939 /DNA_END=1121 /DNA_ORIENTATION=+